MSENAVLIYFDNRKYHPEDFMEAEGRYENNLINYNAHSWDQ